MFGGILKCMSWLNVRWGMDLVPRLHVYAVTIVILYLFKLWFISEFHVGFLPCLKTRFQGYEAIVS